MLDDLCDSMNLDRPWCPGLSRLEIVDNKRDFAVARRNIFVFACSLELVTTNVEACAIELEAHDINGRLSSIVHGSNPGKGLCLQESQFLL